MYKDRDESVLSQLQVRYASIYEFENDNIDLTVCDICQNGDSFNGNKIVFCDLCNIGVHQHCYKRDLANEIPRKDWFCQRCSYLIKNNLKPDQIKCFLCSHLTGIIIQVWSELPCSKQSLLEWVHITCVNWMKSIYFEENQETYGSEVSDSVVTDFYSGCKGRIIGFMSPELFTLNCQYCDEKGACIQCDSTLCQKSFHVRCAIKNKLIERENKMEKSKNNQYMMFVYCEFHKMKKAQERLQQVNNSNTTQDETLSNCEAISLTDEYEYKRQKMKQNDQHYQGHNMADAYEMQQHQRKFQQTC